MTLRSLCLRVLCLLVVGQIVAGVLPWQPSRLSAAELPAEKAAASRLMLATGYAPGVEIDQYWVSEKLDGIRGRWDGKRLITRGGLPIDAPAWFTARWPAVPMDGELWIARGRFEDISALVRRTTTDDAAWRDVRFMVFDLPGDRSAFEARVLRMRSLLRHAGVAWLRPVPQFRARDAAQLDATLAWVVSLGGEGLMLHRRDARYRAGRSEDLLKYKPYDDAEARVVGYTAGRGRHAGRVGALIVARPDGLRFRVGSGLTDAQRANPPAVGTQVTYRYNGLTAKGTPRFARFLRVRQ